MEEPETETTTTMTTITSTNGTTSATDAAQDAVEQLLSFASTSCDGNGGSGGVVESGKRKILFVEEEGRGKKRCVITAGVGVDSCVCGGDEG